MSEILHKKIVSLAVMSDQLATQRDILDCFFSPPVIDPQDAPVLEHIQDCLIDAAAHMDELVDKYYLMFDMNSKMSGDLLRKYFLQYLDFND